MTSFPDTPESAGTAPDGLFVVHGELLSSEAWQEIDGFAVPPQGALGADEWAGLGWDELTDVPPPVLRPLRD